MYLEALKAFSMIFIPFLVSVACAYGVFSVSGVGGEGDLQQVLWQLPFLLLV